MKCPICDVKEMRNLDLPKEGAVQLAVCDDCKEYAQVLPNGRIMLLGRFFQRVAAGDERAMAAVSTPTPTTLHSMIEIEDAFERTYSFERAALAGSRRTLLAQMENRLDVAIQRFSMLGFVDDDAIQGLKALREARELVSTMPSRNRGVPDKTGEP